MTCVGFDPATAFLMCVVAFVLGVLLTLVSDSLVAMLNSFGGDDRD